MLSILYSSSQTVFILHFYHSQLCFPYYIVLLKLGKDTVTVVFELKASNEPVLSILYSSSQTPCGDKIENNPYVTDNFPYYIVLLKPLNPNQNGNSSISLANFPYYIVLLKHKPFYKIYTHTFFFPYYIVLLKREEWSWTYESETTFHTI